GELFLEKSHGPTVAIRPVLQQDARHPQSSTDIDGNIGLVSRSGSGS
ncbi:MAG: hypothetical protein K0Q52_1173, partial [Microbacterium sp.]|nr:hypothetical protein [Microbacterium sp.]